MIRSITSFLVTCLFATQVFASTPPPEPTPTPTPTPTPGQSITNGRYVITNKYSGLVLGVVDGSSADGANVVQETNRNLLSQQWDVTSLGGGNYSLRPAHSGKSLDVYEWVQADGADARQWAYLAGDNQQWTINSEANNYFNVKSKFNGKVLEVVNFNSSPGGNVELWTYWGGDSQLWKFTPATNNPTPPPSNGDRCDVAVHDSRNPPAALTLSGNLVTHDPTIIEQNGTFFVLQTGPEDGNMTLPGKQSNNLTSWTGTPGAFTQGNRPSWLTQRVPGAKNLWAPDLSQFGGQYHLYYSVSTFGSNRSCIGHATRTSMTSGSWADRGAVMCSSTSDNFNAIDPNIVVDDAGTAWMSFGSFWDGIKMVKLRQDGSRADSAVHSLASRGGGAIEAPVIVKRCGYYYLFVSFDSCCNGASSTYNIRVGRSTNILGPYTDKSGRAMMSGGGTQLVSSSYRWKGPGHNSVFFTGNKAYNLYHAYKYNNGEPNLRISELVWDASGWPISGGP